MNIEYGFLWPDALIIVYTARLFNCKCTRLINVYRACRRICGNTSSPRASIPDGFCTNAPHARRPTHPMLLQQSASARTCAKTSWCMRPHAAEGGQPQHQIDSLSGVTGAIYKSKLVQVVSYSVKHRVCLGWPSNWLAAPFVAPVVLSLLHNRGHLRLCRCNSTMHEMNQLISLTVIWMNGMMHSTSHQTLMHWYKRCQCEFSVCNHYFYKSVLNWERMYSYRSCT